MTKLWILSDLHLESVPYPSAFDPVRPDFDVLVVAGDVWQANLQAGMSFMRHLAGSKPVVFVLGNHEHRFNLVSETIAVAREYAQAYGITLLEDSEAIVEGIRFAGGTLWTDNTLGPPQQDETWIGEELTVMHGNAPRRMTVGDGRWLHARTVAAIEAALSGPDDLPLVVVTHHAPHPFCTQGFMGTWAAGNSASDLSHLIDTGKAALWVHGHVHHSIDLGMQSGTRILCNPAGNMLSNPNFVDNLVVEVSPPATALAGVTATGHQNQLHPREP